MGSRSKRCAALVVGPFLLGPALVLGAALLAACGGSEGSSGPSPKSAQDHDSTSADRDEAAPEGDAPAEEEAPKAGPCDDGTCSACGAGVCPSGWYCDESAAGGPACGWLPQCAQKSSCACLTGKLGSSCKCNEQAGGLHVTCK